jgi:hypothetical protein
VRRTALYLELHEGGIISGLASHVVVPRTRLESCRRRIQLWSREVFDLAINFILFLGMMFAQHLDEITNPLTTTIFNLFVHSHPAHLHTQNLIFQAHTPQSQEFLIATYIFTACSPVSTKSYFGGLRLHAHVPPLRKFTRDKEGTFPAEGDYARFGVVGSDSGECKVAVDWAFG